MTENYELVTVDFYGQKLISSKNEHGNILVAMKPICENIGLDWEAQRQRIQRDSVLNSSTCVIKAVAEDGKNREMLALPLEMLNGWLFGIDENRIYYPGTKDTIIKYKQECFNALYNYYHKGVAVNQQFPDILNILEAVTKQIREQNLQLVQKDQVIQQKQEVIEELKPVADFVESSFKTAKRCMKLAEWAKMHAFVYPDGKQVSLKGKKGSGSIFELLKGDVPGFSEIKYLQWNNIPYGIYDSNNGNGYFEIKLYEADYAPTPRITPKGQEAVFKKFAKHGIHPQQIREKTGVA